MISDLRRWMLLCEAETIQHDKVAFHGTTLENARAIIRFGFSPKLAGTKSGAGLKGVSTSLIEEIAQEHAEWAVEKFGGKPAILSINLTHLNIMSGKDFLSAGSFEAGCQQAIEQGFDATEVFDTETGDGIEEMEILIFAFQKIKAKIA